MKTSGINRLGRILLGTSLWDHFANCVSVFMPHCRYDNRWHCRALLIFTTSYGSSQLLLPLISSRTISISAVELKGSYAGLSFWFVLPTSRKSLNISGQCIAMVLWLIPHSFTSKYMRASSSHSKSILRLSRSKHWINYNGYALRRDETLRKSIQIHYVLSGVTAD